MKQSFHHRLVNGPFEDPSLFVRFSWQRRAMLFDAGWLGRLEQGDILKISDVFITHAHIDHFIGFDTLLRALLRRDMPINVYGPSDIIDRIEGKLAGYTWNLISEYPLRIEAYAIDGNIIHHASFYAKNRFRKEERDNLPFTGTVLKNDSFSVKATTLHHDIQCLAFSLEEDFHINIDKARLLEMGLPVGPWLSELKQTIRHDNEREFLIDGKSYGLGSLKHIALITKGQKITYISDCAPSEENISRAIGLAKGSDTLYCEAYFLDADMERAVERNHLTAKISGRIAREAGVNNLVLMHFSPKYRDEPNAPAEEAVREWKRVATV